ncbi:hypothetical protein EI94DRAFT_1815350 [Lactarius quietus]|nr:hypothetical protein EI94DRAFT_1815350 [Lactarius quietus]
MTVPSLLKRWNRLQSGYDSSAQAYTSLSMHLSDKMEKWLQEDVDAQANRHVPPSAMDIYDTDKGKAPSLATIQQQLMVEEIGDCSIRGQTSWISYGIRIQDMQLAIRYQLQSQGPQLTMEDAQIIENKWMCLQKLIDMFEYQADAFLFNHKLSENDLMSHLGDYSEYDHADDLDDSGVPGYSDAPHPTHYHDVYNSGESGTNAEDITILLPSSLGWEWCLSHGHETLAVKESKLRFAQATDSIHRIRLALGFKSALFRSQVRHAHMQKTKSWAWSAVHGVDAMVYAHAQNYSMARDAYIKVRDPSVNATELPPLQLTDLRVNTAILGAKQQGQWNRQLP